MMASAETFHTSKRFNVPSEDDLNNIVDQKDSKNTKQSTEYAVKCFNLYLSESSDDENCVATIDSLSPDELDQQLAKFFAGARKTDGTKYKKTSLVSLRFGIARYVQKAYKIDVLTDPRFCRSSEVYKAVLVELKREGYAAVNHYPAISDDDLKKLYTSHALSPNTPSGLQNKVWFDIMFYTCRRGRENLRLMDKDTFGISTDAANHTFVFQKRDEMDKNHRENDTNICSDGRMYEWKGHPLCPVASYKKYVTKLHPDRKDLWQRPKVQGWSSSATWYMNCSVGVNTLGSLMKRISNDAALSRVYTNHCIRATMVSTLDSANFEARHIMTISGHKSKASIRSYSHGVTDKQKQSMFSELSRAVAPEEVIQLGQTANDSDNESVFSMEGDELLSSSQCEYLVENLSLPPSSALAPSELLSSSHSENLVANLSLQPLPTLAPLAKGVQHQPNSNILDNILGLPGFNIAPNINNCVVNFNFNIK